VRLDPPQKYLPLDTLLEKTHYTSYFRQKQVKKNEPRSPRRPLCHFVRSLPQVFIPCARSTLTMRPTRKAVRFFARALGALAEVLLSERYYHSDIRRTAVLDSAAQASAFPCPSFIWTCGNTRPYFKVPLGPQSGTIFAQRGSDKGPRPLSKAKASQSWGNGMCADSASRAVLRVSCLRC
jgi:hypothetical protein